MSTADLFDETWPHTHGTADGYDHGCKSGACPAGEQYGLSCKTARSLSRSDFKYQRMVRNGATVADVANDFGFVGTLNPSPAAPAKAPPASKSKRTKEQKPVNKPTPATARGGRSLAATKTAETQSSDAPSQRSTDIWEETARRIGTAVDASEQTPPAPAPAVDEPTPEPNGEPGHGEKSDGAAATVEPTTSEIRAWARDRGYEIGDKGRIPAHIRAHYDDAHPGGTPISLAKQIAKRIAEQLGATAAEEPAAETTDAASPDAPQGDSDADGNPRPADDTARPDWGHVALLEDLRTVTDERDRARAIATRLEQELANAEEQLAKATADSENARGEADSMATEYLDEFSKVIALEERLERRTAERDEAEKQLRIAQKATALTLTKWGEERQANEASYQVILGQAHTINTLTEQLADRPHLVDDSTYTGALPVTSGEFRIEGTLVENPGTVTFTDLPIDPLPGITEDDFRARVQRMFGR